MLPVLLALLPIVWLIVALSVLRLKAWQATLSALLVALAVALSAFRTALPLAEVPGVMADGVLFALHPIGLIILAALFTYGVTVDSGAMKTIREGLARVSEDRRILALLIVWGFGNFMEGMAGYGTAVAIPAAILVGIGFDPFRAVLMCLIANTTPTAFGAVGVPMMTLALKSGTDLAAVGWTTACLQALVNAALPVLVLLALDGRRALKGMSMPLFVTEVAFLVPSFLTARYVGAELPDIVGGLAVLLSLGFYATRGRKLEGVGKLCFASLPFAFVVVILGVAAFLPPSLKKSPGLLVLVAGFAGGLVQRLSFARLLKLLGKTVFGYWSVFVTTCAVLALARVMGAAGMILALANALVSATGAAYPHFAALVGALGGFVTGSGTSSCALFGELQAKAAEALGVSPNLLAAANVMGAGIGKMISPQSIAIGAAAAGLAGKESVLLKRALPWFLGLVLAACLLTGLSENTRPPSCHNTASPQLEALKDSWARETSAPLPRTRAEWETWRRDEVAPLRAMVDRAAALQPFLNTRFVEGARTNRAVVAIGGSGETLDTIWLNQGRHFAALGFGVLMVENPPDDIARLCLERNVSWLAYGTAALLPRVRELRRRYPALVWSGFSLGTELMMATATLESAPGDVFVYNDFLCRSKERLIVMDGEPNGLRNLTPGYFCARDFPERMLALSDHPILFTEGGLDRDFAIVRSIFPENVTCYHQPKFRDVDRFRGATLPRRLNLADYFRLCNVDPSNHYYKFDLVRDWLVKTLPDEMK